jgi:membrane protein YqaA with SNARE-associated domain
LICTVTSVLGGLLGYAIGAFLYDTIGHWLINLYHLDDKAEQLRDCYGRVGWIIILIKGATPIPYKLVTIVSGLAAYSLPLFIILSLITRGARFFILALLLNRFGEPIKEALDRRFGLFMTLLLVIIIAGFVAAGHFGGGAMCSV